MKLLSLLFSIIYLFSCSDLPVNVDGNKGTVSFRFEKPAALNNLVNVKATLTRVGFDTLSKSSSLLSNSTVEIVFDELVAGNWHLKVEALDSNDKAIYAGEKDVEIIPGEMVAVSLRLVPVIDNLGSLFVYADWDNLPYYWFDYPANPILIKDGSEYDGYGLLQACVIKDGNIYKMWYTGLSHDGITYIYYATSNDGLVWNKYGSSPVLSPGTNSSWDSMHAGTPTVIKDGNVYKMFYSGWSDQYSKWSIGLATSTDGISWTKNPLPILQGGEWDYQLVATSVIKGNSIYRLYYVGRASTYSNSNIGLATSPDGINWQKHPNNPILSASQNWESNSISYPSIIFEDNLYKMVYQGGNSSNISFGLAYSNDGVNWVKNLNEPFFDLSKISTNITKMSYPFLIKTDSEYRIYYTGNASPNSVICVARKIIN